MLPWHIYTSLICEEQHTSTTLVTTVKKILNVRWCNHIQHKVSSARGVYCFAFERDISSYTFKQVLTFFLKIHNKYRKILFSHLFWLDSHLFCRSNFKLHGFTVHEIMGSALSSLHLFCLKSDGKKRCESSQKKVWK